MIETHPYPPFVPQNAKYLILGSFPSKERLKESGEEFYYINRRNQFWKILEKVYDTDLNSLENKKALLEELNIAFSDVIYQCERINKNSLDSNLINIKYNYDAIKKILQTNDIRSIYFTSRFVENIFKRHYKDMIIMYPRINLITLPSPSPRYAHLQFDDKVSIYKELLPIN